MSITTFDGKWYSFSNFSYDPVVYEDIWYPTSEHAFQAAKTFDIAERQRIASLPSPREAKAAGRKVVLRPDWEDVKYDIMVEILRDKFSERNPQARQTLLDSGTEYLEEGNTWHDNCWGNCRCARCINIEGTNFLGQALMQVRGEIISGAS